MRRVVVTGLSAITPLGVGVRRTWSRLLAGESGIINVTNREPAVRWKELPSQVAGVVPEGRRDEGKWQALDWLNKGEERRLAQFTQYAIAATEMAFEDAGWRPQTREEQEMTGVCLGSGIGNLEELYNTSIAHSENVSAIQQYLLGNLLRMGGRVIRKSRLFSFRSS
jgi:3-oxoacyl-[acyl-carrier-protein] synthase II